MIADVLTPAIEAEPDYRALYQGAQRRFERERRARLQAEAIAERGLSDLYQRERHVALMEAVARHANGSSSQTEALGSTLREVCAYTGWACGFVYVPADTQDRRLVLSPIWLAAGEGLETFVAATQAVTFPPRLGLPGRVDSSKRPAWIRDVGQDGNFIRKAEAAACGLRAGIAFPILVESKVAAVVEFFAREAIEPDLAFLAVLDAIGTQLGRVVERGRAQDRLRHDALHDPLTGLPNRALFLDKLSARIAAATDQASTYAVLFIDLDRFKLVNDSLGHRAGDALLIEISRRFRSSLASPGPTEPHLLARMGGDEFVVLLDGISGMTAAAEMAERLLAALAVPIEIEGHQLYGAASIGVTCGIVGYPSAAEVLRDADLAMYAAKSGGKARVSVFEPHMHLQAVARLAMESDLRRALREDQFVLHYQPIVATADGRQLGFEALVRWQKSPGVLVPPGAFIEVAEETGLIVFIGEWVVRQACAAAARWNARRAAADAITVSVNVSAKQFQQSDFTRSVARAIRESGASPAMLRIEVTESAAIANIEEAIATLAALREMGVGISIDDFGTGHSSLSYLHRLTFDEIKIDRSFVQAMDEDGAHIVQTILDLARNLDVTVVAEGAETAEQVEGLARLGCGFVQGFHISRPLDEAAATAWLQMQQASFWRFCA